MKGELQANVGAGRSQTAHDNQAKNSHRFCNIADAGVSKQVDGGLAGAVAPNKKDIAKAQNNGQQGHDVEQRTHHAAALAGDRNGHRTQNGDQGGLNQTVADSGDRAHQAGLDGGNHFRVHIVVQGSLLLHAQDNAEDQRSGNGLRIVPGKVAGHICAYLLRRIEHLEEGKQPPGPALPLNVDGVHARAAVQQIANIEAVALSLGQGGCSDGIHSISSSSSAETTAAAGLFIVR